MKRQSFKLKDVMRLIAFMLTAAMLLTFVLPTALQAAAEITYDVLHRQQRS